MRHAKSPNGEHRDRPSAPGRRVTAVRILGSRLAGRNGGRGPVGIMGAGWVGLVTAGCFAELGREVVVRDIDRERIDTLRRGAMPLHDPALADLLRRNMERLTFTVAADDMLARCGIVFVCVGTPATRTGDADLSAVWSILDEIAASGAAPTLVMKSTVPVGTGARVAAELADRGLARVAYVSNPEFLGEGAAVHDVLNPQRIVIGTSSRRAADALTALYAPLRAPVVRTDVASAEMIKYASNAFLATKISFINEIANVCEATGADVEVVARGMGLDDRIGPRFLDAGIGYGGSCFPNDVAALKQLAGNSGYHFQLLTSVIEVNELQKRRVLTKLKRHTGPLAGKTVTLLGLAFKPNTSDVRNAASLVLSSRLLAEGANVRAWDPVAVEAARPLLRGVELYDDLLDAVRGADAAIVVTEWDELRTLPLRDVRRRMRTPVIIDGRNMLDPTRLRRAGFVYESVGRPSAPPSERLPQSVPQGLAASPAPL